MGKKWKIFIGGDCPNCGGTVHVLTDCVEEKDSEFEQWFRDGDIAECYDDCGWKGGVSCDGENVWLQDGNIDELEECE